MRDEARAFLAVLRRDPQRALAALGWWLRGKRQRARNRLHLATAPDSATQGQASGEARAAPPVPQPEILASIALAPDADADLAAFIEDTPATFIAFHPAGAVLASHALPRFADAIAANPDAAVFYADCDLGDAGRGRGQPWCKPEWDADLLLAQDYLSQIGVIRADVARVALAFARRHPGVFVYALLLAATRDGSAPGAVHVPHVLAQLPPDHTGTGQGAHRAAVADHLAGTGAVVEAGRFGTTRVAWPLPAGAALPLVSVIIPTRDRAELLRVSAGGVLGATDYPNIELLIVDNGSREAASTRLLAELAADPRVHILRDDSPFNFSRLNNATAEAARGPYLCLLNNDTEVIEPGWLTALMRQAVRPGVGAVGAKLLYPDGSIQHAGVVLGPAGAEHAHRFLPDAEAGDFAAAHVARAVSAVTAACLLVEKAKYMAVGGLDEALAVAFNDVDLCLKLGAAGWRNIYEPAARLIHHESKSRDTTAPDAAARAQEAALIRRRWGSTYS